jgi:hypothetical protein
VGFDGFCVGNASATHHSSSLVNWSISFLVDKVTSAITIGYQGHRIMSGMICLTASKTLSELSRTMKHLQETGELTIDRDHNRWSLTPNIEIIIFARNTGRTDSVAWTVAIQILYKTDERPDVIQLPGPSMDLLDLDEAG